MANITKSFVDNISFTRSKQQIYWDEKLKGFGLNVGKTAKTFIVQFDVHGKAKRKKIGRYSQALTVAKARDKAKNWLGDLAIGIIPWEVEAEKRAQTITFKEAWDKFIANKKDKGNLSAKTIRNYEHSIGYLKGWYQKDMSKITHDMVEEKHRKIGKEHGQYQANSVFRVFRAVYNYALKIRRNLPMNPAFELEWYKESRRKNAMPPTVLPVFWKMLDEHIDTPMRRDYYRLILFTGLRRASASSIMVEDIDLGAKTLHIPAPKGGEEKAFDLPLSDYLCKLIEGLLEDNDSEWLFPSKTSKSGHIVEPKEPDFVNKLEDETGHHVTIHSLRNTFTTVAESLDISAYAIKLLVNHALPKSDVTGGYINPDVERLRDPMQRITTRLLSLVEPEEKGKKVVGIRR
ncbi:hypothetical protein MNBD_GAMMA14-2383 [hydrothermal vent metagenome]|uniref:Tyr recombinase domain-containing protein n=1 Tax=hydrothermal vent metagenome TaxID=652676 RepID=A0A3B0XZC6_9ZZZZ